MTHPGFVYFIEAVGADAIKIGWAKKPERRLTLLQIGCPLELRILATAPASLGHEGALQTKFAPQCIRGEWYRHSAELDEFIAAVSQTGKLPDDIVPALVAITSNRPGIDALLRCIVAAGSQKSVAQIVGVTQAGVSNVLQRGKRVPSHWCLRLEAETLRLGMPVWRDELRPDLYPDDKYLHPDRFRFADAQVSA